MQIHARAHPLQHNRFLPACCIVNGPCTKSFIYLYFWGFLRALYGGSYVLQEVHIQITMYFTKLWYYLHFPNNNHTCQPGFTWPTVVGRAGSHSVIGQASKCLCVRWGCLFEQGDWTLHWPSGMIRPTLICCYTDPHMQKKEKKWPYHIIPWAAWPERLYRSREKQDRPGLRRENTHLFSPNHEHTQKPRVCDKRTHSHLRKYARACTCKLKRQTTEHTLQMIPRHPQNKYTVGYTSRPSFHPAPTVDEAVQRQRAENKRKVLK